MRIYAHFLRYIKKEAIMENILNVSQMKALDQETIVVKHLPSLVLIENAANKVVEFIESNFHKKMKIGIFAGIGNNGADAIAIARILATKDYLVDLYILSNVKRSKECEEELLIAENFQVPIFYSLTDRTYDLLIDGIFGIGLNRMISGVFLEYITFINQSGGVVISLDIPSGINGNNGAIMGAAVKANYTITFGYKKTGLLLLEGPNYSGEIICKNIGLFKSKFIDESAYIQSYEKSELPVLPKRKLTGNKGTFGKVLIFAGSKEYGGAVSLVSLATYRTGSGMVHIITHSENKQMLLEKNPEALISCYDDKNFPENFHLILSWADVIVAGPGIGLNKTAKEVFNQMLSFIDNHRKVPFIIDADALTFLLDNNNLNKIKQFEHVICTPHVKEFSKLINSSVQKVKENIIEYVSDFSKKWGVITVCKDAKTFVFEGSSGKSYLNQSGNNGMATAGSGDVLAGILASLISQGMPPFNAAYTAVHIHGLAGDFSQQQYGRGMVATDLIENMKIFIKENL